jgi:hypothetical protein
MNSKVREKNAQAGVWGKALPHYLEKGLQRSVRHVEGKEG